VGAHGPSGRNRHQPFPELSPGDAHAVIRWLCALGKVTPRDIRAALRERDSLVAEATRKPESLDGQGGQFLRRIEGLQRGPKTVDQRTSMRERAAWMAEERYKAALRGLPKAARARVNSIRERRGIASAIAAARRLSRSDS